MTHHFRILQEIYEVTKNIDNLTFFGLFPDYEPIKFQVALDKNTWRTSIDKEIKVIKNNETWELASLPKGNKVISLKWVYKAKKTFKGEVERYKS